MTDLEIYRDMLSRAGEAFEEKAVGAETLVISSQNCNEGSYSVVMALFHPDGALKGINPEGCTWDCDGCRS